MAATAAEKAGLRKYVTSMDGWSLRFSYQTKPASTARPPTIVPSTGGSAKSASSPPLMMP